MGVIAGHGSACLAKVVGLYRGIGTGFFGADGELVVTALIGRVRVEELSVAVIETMVQLDKVWRFQRQ